MTAVPMRMFFVRPATCMPMRWTEGQTEVGGEVVLSEPDAVVAGLVHDVDAVEGAVVDGWQGDSASGPAEELEDAELHPAVVGC